MRDLIRDPCEPHHGTAAPDPPIAAVVKYRCFVFQVFQRARFCAGIGWGNAVSADSDAVSETNETRNTVLTSQTG